MRILLLGDASNFHAALATALRKMGNEVKLASHGSLWMNTRRDVDLYRSPGKWGSIKYGLKLMSHLQSFCGYDIVQVPSPTFLSLRPEKVSWIFDYLRRHNGKVIYEALGTDTQYVNACIDTDLFRYSDFRIGTKLSPYATERPEVEKEWNSSALVKYNNHFLSKIDGVIASLYEYYKTYEKINIGKPLAYAGIPIEIDENLKPLASEPEKVRFFIGIQRDRSVLKGTDIMLDVAKTLRDRYPEKVDVVVAENMNYDKYVSEMMSSHVLLDQLYSYTPATNALLAMSRGLVAMSGAEPEYYDFIGEKENHPIVNVSPLLPNDVVDKLEWIVKNKHLIPKLSQLGMKFVHDHNDSLKIAQKHLDFWQKI